jgi:hypothetical protein
MKSQKATWKLVSPLQAKKKIGKILSLRQVFLNLVSCRRRKNFLGKNAVAEPSFLDEKKKKDCR